MINNNEIRSPFTGGKVTKRTESASLEFRGDTYHFERAYYVCEDTGLEFTTSELDDANMEAVYSQYREKYGIPSPKEIIAIRKSYGLPASAMSKILGLGANQYGLYERGLVPSESVGKMIRSVSNKDVFMGYFSLAKVKFSPEEYRRYSSKIFSADAPQTYEYCREIAYSSFSSTGDGGTASFRIGASTRKRPVPYQVALA